MKRILSQKNNFTRDARIIKHQKLTNIVCCPICHGILEFENSDFFLDIPIFCILTCNKCGEIGQIFNMKFLFNQDNAPLKNNGGKKYSGELSITPLHLTTSHFSPSELWHLNGGQFLSAHKKAKFFIQCNSLSISLVFLKHPWSGIAKIILDGKEIDCLDLFEEKGSISIWYPIYLNADDHLIEVEVTGEKNPMSKDAQIILIGAETLNIKLSSELKINYPSRNYGNPYPECFEDLIKEADDNALVLDCGSGDRSHPDPRVINFENCRFRSPDIFGDGHKLPFKENSFDLILSQAVIEHLYDPFTAVSEIYRVLKPGGLVYVESAFMQPLHAAPYHYFNTTNWGLEHLFKSFQVLKSGNEGRIRDTLAWFYNLTALRKKGLGVDIDKVLNIVNKLDMHITDEELKYFASYVTLLARKP